MVDDLAVRVEELTRRVQRLEDERAVVDLLTRYGFGVDSDEADGTAAMYAEGCTVEVDGTTSMRSRDDVAAMVRGRGHQSILPRCAHQMGPFSVRVDGDTATATGYGRVYLRSDDGFEVWRVSAGRWELRRRGEGWEVAHRWTRSIGTADAQRLLREGL